MSNDNNPQGGNTAMTPTPFDTAGFEHLNLNDVDTTAQAVDANVYTLEIAKLEPAYRTISKEDSPYKGQQVLVLRGAFIIVDDEKYSGRRIFKDFWTPYRGAQVGLRKLQDATGVKQTEGQLLTEWASQFALLNPPAKFQAPVTKGPDRRDPDGPAVNDIDAFKCRPA
jgi:hypothetical protein